IVLLASCCQESSRDFKISAEVNRAPVHPVPIVRKCQLPCGRDVFGSGKCYFGHGKPGAVYEPTRRDWEGRSDTCVTPLQSYDTLPSQGVSNVELAGSFMA